MAINYIKKIYLQKIAEDLRINFEKKTGKDIGTGKYFDMTEIINFYGGLIEYSDIYEENHKLKAYICKVDNNEKYDFKFVIDKKISQELKPVNENGMVCYGNWNMFIMRLFYFVIELDEKIEKLKKDEIFYPDSDEVKEALLYIENHKYDVEVEENDNIFIGNTKSFMKFIETYQSKNEFLEEECFDSNKNMQLSKRLKRHKY